MSLARFHIPASAWNPDALFLDGDEASHCAGVMRRGVGDKIIVFNGAGAWATAEITAASKQRVELNTLDVAQSKPPKTSLSLLQAIPKGSNMDLIIEKAVELGGAHIYPVMTARTVVSLDGKDAVKKQAKWQRLALEACKQCGQNWLPEVHMPRRITDVLSTIPAHDLKVVAAIQEDARPLKAILADFKTAHANPSTAIIAIGPEGDFTPAEYALLHEQTYLPLTLGPIILRVETAAMFCLSVLRHELH
jgi:16S rRNA (uracil1498-N3)-methyltransferase